MEKNLTGIITTTSKIFGDCMNCLYSDLCNQYNDIAPYTPYCYGEGEEVVEQ